jgi:hypothetical protein
MAYHYTLKNFVRQASNTLLVEYFRAKGINLGVDLEALKPKNVDPIADAIDRLGEDEQNKVNRDFQKVAALGDRAGLRQIVEEARFNGLDIAPGLEAQRSVVNQAFWTFLRFPLLFEAAAQFAVPYALGRYWKRGLPVTGASIGDPDTKVKTLEDAVSAYFRSEEGRGKACKVEYRKRGSIHQFHAFPEDYPAAPMAWSNLGLEPHPFRPAFEVVFVFHEGEGSLYIYFEGGKPTVERLWQIFAATVLGIDDLREVEKPAYAVDRLRSSSFTFVRSPDSPIIDVRIKKLGFAILGFPSTKVSVETDGSRDPHAIHEMVRRTFAHGEFQPGRFALSQAKVISATLVATIDPRNGRKPRVRTFDLSARTCSLKYEESDFLLRRMLTDSGIDQAGIPANAADGLPRQVA